MTVTQSFGPPRSRATSVTALIASAVIVLLLLGQLFGYEDMPLTLAVVMPFNELPLLTATAAGLIFVELLALPYLLGMYISPLMRFVSALAALTTGMFWLIVALTNAHAGNVGLLSTTVDIPGGIGAALLGTVLFGCIVRVVAADSKFRHQTATPLR